MRCQALLNCHNWLTTLKIYGYVRLTSGTGSAYGLIYFTELNRPDFQREDRPNNTVRTHRRLYPMPESESHSLDILGVKPVSEAVSCVTKATVDGASSFLSRICLPAAEEFGLLLQDKVRAWRANNAIRVVTEGQARYDKYLSGQSGHAHPRLVATVIEEGSWTDDSTLQKMWGGLLASSCSANGLDDSNLIFVGLLKQLTGLQIHILSYACETSVKAADKNNLIIVKTPLTMNVSAMLEIAASHDIHRVDRELDHLRSIELIHGGFTLDSTEVDITPTALALNLYVRCQGWRGSAVKFFGLEVQENKQ